MLIRDMFGTSREFELAFEIVHLAEASTDFLPIFIRSQRILERRDVEPCALVDFVAVCDVSSMLVITYLIYSMVCSPKPVLVVIRLPFGTLQSSCW
jgi:hypothetical protein